MSLPKGWNLREVVRCDSRAIAMGAVALLGGWGQGDVARPPH
jgi:hypothetical protein